MIDRPSTPKTIFLDAGGVLVWPNWQRVADTLRRHDVIVSAAALAAADPYARWKLDRADIIRGSRDQGRGFDFFDLVLDGAGVVSSARTMAALAELQEYQRLSNLWEHVPEFVRPALGELKAQGYRLSVISNSNGSLRRLLDRLELAEFFDVLVDSAEEQLEKPDARLFERALLKTSTNAAETIHVGDMYYVDVVGARAAGIRPVLIDEANLRPEADCVRIRSIAELPALLANWQSEAARGALQIEFVPGTSIYRERDRISQFPILRNGPPGTFVIFPDGLRVSLPTDQIISADDARGRACVVFGGMRLSEADHDQLTFVRVRELHPEEQLSPARSHTMRLERAWVSSILEDGEPIWPRH